MTRKEKIRARLVKAMQMASDKSLHLILHTSTKGVRKQKNIRYDDTRGHSLLDVYDTLDSRDNLRPVFIYFHGGGFTSGSKEPRLYYCAKWAEEGYAAVNVDYNCGIDHPFPSFLQQAFRAIEWVFDHAHIHQFDTTRIVLAGESAGAYIAAFIAAISRHHELYDKLNIRFSHHREFNPQACVLISGIYDLEGILSLDFPNIEDCLTGFTGQGREHSLAFVKSSDAKAASPLHYVDERFPPTAVILSDKDPLRPCSEALCEKLALCGVARMDHLCTGKIAGVHAGGLCTHTRHGRLALKRAQAFTASQLNGGLYMENRK